MIWRLAPLLVLLGCAAQGQTYETDIGPLRVFYDENFPYFTGPIETADGTIEPFPASGAVRATFPNGAELPFSNENEAAARQALFAYCLEDTGFGELAEFSFQNGKMIAVCAGPTEEG